MSYEDQKLQYRFPKSRSKRLPDAVELARKLSGFAENTDGFQVSPTPEEAEGETFGELLKISENWKGAAFFRGDDEISKDQFLEAFKSPNADAGQSKTPEPSAPPEAEEEAVEPEEPETPKKSSEVVSASEDDEEEDDEVEVVFVKPKPAPPPPPRPPQPVPAKSPKKRGACCCCWWLPFGAAALMALIFNLFVG